MGRYTSVGIFCTLCTYTFRDSILKPFVYTKSRRVKSDIKPIGIGNIKYRFLFCISHLSQIICAFATKIKFCNYIDFCIQISKRKFCWQYNQLFIIKTLFFGAFYRVLIINLYFYIEKDVFYGKRND